MAYIEVVGTTATTITVRLAGLDTNYEADDRYMMYYGNINPSEFISIPGQVSTAAEYTFGTIEEPLIEGTTYTIYATVYYTDNGSEVMVELGPIEVTTTSDKLRIEADSITSTSFRVWSNKDDGWFKWTLSSRGSVIEEQTGVSMFDTYFSGLTPNTEYLVELEWSPTQGSSVLETGAIYVTTASPPQKPSCKILSIERTSDRFAVTIQNTSAYTFCFNVYSNTNYSTSDLGNEVDSIDIEPEETATFETSITGDNQYRAFFFYISAQYNNYNDEFFYPSSGSTLTVDGKKYAILTDDRTSSWRWIKVDVESDAPWDSLYDTYTYPSSILSHYMWAPYTGSVSEIVNGHEDIYVSTNQRLNDTTSSMVIEIDLLYKSTISFNYQVRGNDALKITLGSESTTASKNNNTWVNYTKELDVGVHILTLSYVKDDETDYSNDFVCFADFAIIPLAPTLWDWEASNGKATQTQTVRAYNAITNKGKTSEFSHLVWNDMVNKVKNILDYGYRNGRTTYVWISDFCDYEDTVMTEYDMELTAQRFNSLRFNIGARESTGIDEVYPGDQVYGRYFTTLTNAINAWIEKLQV